MRDKFNLKELHKAVEFLHTRKDSHRGFFMEFLLSLYAKESDINTVKKIDANKIVEVVYGPPPKDPKAYDKFLKDGKKKFTSLKSSLNTSFRDLFSKGLNPKRVGITRNNTFGYLPESKDEIIKKLSLSLDILSIKFFDPKKKGRDGKLDIGEVVEKFKNIAELEKQAKKLKNRLAQEIEDQIAEGKRGGKGEKKEKLSADLLDMLDEMGISTGEEEGREGTKARDLGRKEGKEGTREAEKDAGQEEGTTDSGEGRKGQEADERGKIGDTAKEEGREGTEARDPGRREGEEGTREAEKDGGQKEGTSDSGEGKRSLTEGVTRKGEEIEEEEDWVKGKVSDGEEYQELTEEEKKWLEEKRAQKEAEESKGDKKEKEEGAADDLFEDKSSMQTEDEALKDLYTDGEFEEGLGAGSGEIRKPLGRMLLVPKGPFIFGCNTDDIAFRPERTIDVDEFLISQYPINNFQFSKFIEKTDYVTEAEIENRSWVFTGMVWNRVVEMDEDGFEEERIIFDKGSLHEVEGANWKHPAGPLSSIENRMDAPVVHVSLKDVLEFLAWRSKVTGKVFRLPTETEWEKAARGSDGNIYPWGNEWDPAKCNSYDSKTNGITDVDRHQGDSPYNVQDLIGNVWEWTLGVDRPLDIQEVTEILKVRERKGFPVLKGGSWMTSRHNLTAYTKVKYPPTMRSNFIGFRCANSPSNEKRNGKEER